MAAEKKLELTIVPSSLTVNTDRNLLRRLIQNLVSNAIKYTRTGRILVGVRRRGELAEIQVFDTGIGIAADKLNTVFREFTRLDEGAREAQGLGLGLSIVDRIARVLRLEIQHRFRQGQGHALLGDPAGHRRRRSRRSAVEAPRRMRPRRRARRHGRALHRQRPAHPRRHAAAARRLGLHASAPRPGSSVDRRTPRAARRPDIVLADYHLDGETGLDAIRKLRAVFGDGIAGRAGHRRPLQRGARRRRRARRAGDQQAAEAGRAALDDDAGQRLASAAE